MTTTEPKVPAGAVADEWFTIDHDGLPTSRGRNVTTRNLSPYRTGPDIRVQVVHHPDGTYDENTLAVRVDDEELSGEDARHLASSLTKAAQTFEQWSVITQPRVKPIECMRGAPMATGTRGNFSPKIRPAEESSR
jgi:hypothetical protein